METRTINTPYLDCESKRWVVCCELKVWSIPDSKVHGANMGPIWGWQDPGGPHVGPMNFAIWDEQPLTLLGLNAPPCTIGQC